MSGGSVDRSNGATSPNSNDEDEEEDGKGPSVQGSSPHNRLLPTLGTRPIEIASDRDSVGRVDGGVCGATAFSSYSNELEVEEEEKKKEGRLFQDSRSKMFVRLIIIVSSLS